LEKCVGIINGLSSALDLDSGSEVVKNLARLYDYCASRLYRAGVDMNAAIVDEVCALLGHIRSGWQGVKTKNG